MSNRAQYMLTLHIESYINVYKCKENCKKYIGYHVRLEHSSVDINIENIVTNKRYH